MQKIYLAGPDVFLHDALEIGRAKQALCREAGMLGLFPLDADPSIDPDPTAIFRANRALMDQADIGLFNLTPFRGPGADAGTVFELGYMYAQGKPVHGYSGIEPFYAARVAKACGPVSERNGRRWDRAGIEIENFDLADNLMMLRAIAESGGRFSAVQEPSGGLAAFTAFRRSLHVLATTEEID